MFILNQMVNYKSTHFDSVFHALSDSTRRAILVQIASKECTISELAHPFRMSLPAISKHIKVLERAKLLKRVRKGRLHHCRINPKPLVDAAALIQFYRQFWDERLASLEAYFKTKGDGYGKNN